MDRRQPHIHDVVVVLKTDDELLHCRFKSDYVELSPAFPLKDTERDLPTAPAFSPEPHGRSLGSAPAPQGRNRQWILDGR